MATTPNQKPVPSEDYANMRFNAGKLDELITSTELTYTDRLGQEHMTAEGIRASADDLRSDLASSDAGKGSSLVLDKKDETGSISRTQHEINEEKISVIDFGADKSGATSSQSAFSNASSVAKPIFIPAGTYSLSSDVEGNFYSLGGVKFNGVGVARNRNFTIGSNTIPQGITSLAVNNVAVGDNVLRSLTEGYGNVGLGRSVMPSITTGINNTGMGYNVMVNTTTAFNNTAIGRNALLENTTGSENSAFGWASQQRTTTGENNSSYGRSTLEFNITGSFNNAHGSTAMFNNTSGNYNQAYGCSALWSNTTGSYNMAFGTDSLYFNLTGSNNSAFGDRCLRGSTGGNNTGFGRNIMQTTGSSGTFNVAVGIASMSAAAVTGTENTSIGQSSLLNLTTGNYNTACGSSAIGRVSTGSYNSSVGMFSLNLDQAGVAHNYDNCTGLGYSTRVSGANQVQIGNAATTTYVYGTVQNRSDLRDKADWRDPDYSLEFIRGLRAREYRWDMREDYVTLDDEGHVTINERDGTKKRERFHTGYIAQEVKELCDKLGVDFGGYQDHSIDGGCDVLSLGYDEFIPHVQKAVAMAWDKLDELESRIAKLESKK